MSAAQTPKKPALPLNKSAVVEGCARALHDNPIPVPEKSLGEEMVERALRDRTADEDGPRAYVLFAEDWRNFIRSMTPERLKVLSTLVDDEVERRAMRRFWARIYKLLLLVVPAGFAAAQYGIDKLPLIREIIALFKRGTP